MIQRLSTVLAIVLLMSVATSASSIWTLADSDSVLARILFPVSENVEAGIEGVWRTDSERPGQRWAVTGIYTHPETFELDKIFSFDWMPPLTARPFVGASVGVDLEGDDDRTIAGPIAGFIVQDLIVVEYFYQYISDNLNEYMNDGYKLRIGLLPVRF